MFVIDVSKQAISEGSSIACIRALKNMLSTNAFKGKNTKVGIITFDAYVNYYDVRTGTLENVRTLVVDPEDPYPPLPDSKCFFSPFPISSILLSKSNDTGTHSYNNSNNNNNNNNNISHTNSFNNNYNNSNNNNNNNYNNNNSNNNIPTSYDNNDSNSNKSSISNMSNITTKTVYNNNHNIISGISETNKQLDSSNNNEESNCLLLLLNKLEKTCLLDMERIMENEMRNSNNNNNNNNNSHNNNHFNNNNNINNNNDMNISSNSCLSCSVAALKSAQLCLEKTGV